jgi:aspartate racemase
MSGPRCDAAALVCTEIPLLVTPDAASPPTPDSTRLAERAAFEIAFRTRSLPRPRSGPFAP